MSQTVSSIFKFYISLLICGSFFLMACQKEGASLSDVQVSPGLEVVKTDPPAPTDPIQENSTAKKPLSGNGTSAADPRFEATVEREASALAEMNAYKVFKSNFLSEKLSLDYRASVEKLLNDPLFDENKANHLTTFLMEPSYCMSEACVSASEALPKISYIDLSWTMTEVLKTKTLKSERLDVLEPFVHQFQMGAELETEIAGSAGTEFVPSTKNLIQRLKDTQQAVLLADVALTWLSRNKVPLSEKVNLVETLLKSASDMTDAELYIDSPAGQRGVLVVLIDMPSVTEIPQKQQEKMYSFVILRTAPLSLANTKKRLRLLNTLFNFDRKEWNLTGAQVSLELLASIAVDGNRSAPGTEEKSTYDETQDTSVSGRLLTLIQSCQKPSLNGGVRARVCDVIVSKNKIFKILSQNKDAPAETRSRAKKLAATFDSN